MPSTPPIDWRVLSFVLAVTTVTGIAFGIAPALRTTSINVSAALKDTSRSVAGSRSVLTKGLLVLQVAVSLVLLIAAGLFLRTLNHLRHVHEYDGLHITDFDQIHEYPFLPGIGEGRGIVETVLSVRLGAHPESASAQKRQQTER
jgi:hypothetical protein